MAQLLVLAGPLLAAPLLPELLASLGGPALLQTAVTGGGGTIGTGVVGGGMTGLGTVTTVPMVTTAPMMAAMMPGVALGILKALFIAQLANSFKKVGGSSYTISIHVCALSTVG